jgi:hypothetical protein
MKKAWPIYRRSIDGQFAEHLTSAQAKAIRDGLAKVLAANGGGVTVPAGSESQPVQLNVRKR